jgi:type IV secretory pathway VirJ component
VLSLVVSTAACGGVRPFGGYPTAPETAAAVRVQDRWLLVHLSRPAVPSPGQPLIVYVTGDRGWAGGDLETFEHLRRWGWPVAGLSAPDYLDNLRGDAETLPPEALARDFAAVIEAAGPKLGVAPGAGVVLVGVSRGADLVVIAAADSELRKTVTGVVAVALTDEEEYVRGPSKRRARHRANAPAAEPLLEMVRPYDLIDLIASPLSLIQSTRDQYVPAARAAEQFGPEGPNRRFTAISARNHSFAGARRALYHALHASLDWIVASRGPRS